MVNKKPVPKCLPWALELYALSYLTLTLKYHLITSNTTYLIRSIICNSFSLIHPSSLMFMLMPNTLAHSFYIFLMLFKCVITHLGTQDRTLYLLFCITSLIRSITEPSHVSSLSVFKFPLSVPWYGPSIHHTKIF